MPVVTVMFGGQKLGTHNITHCPFVVGRESTCDVVIDNVGISREHCQFTWDGKHYYVEDMESANGTYHHGQRIRKAPVANGDTIQIGKHSLVFSCCPGEPPPSSRRPDDAGGGKKGKTPAITDGMLTFQMDARLILAQSAQSGPGEARPRRASDVASSFAAAPAVSKRRQGSRLARAVLLLVVLGTLAGAVYYLLRSLGYLPPAG